MSDQTLKITDNSGDRNYFTMVPNFVAHKLKSLDLALYFQLKSFAGVKHVSYPGNKLLMMRLGVTRHTLHSALRRLVDAGLIKQSDNVKQSTSGGSQMFRSYEILDVWDKNTDFFREQRGGKKRPTLNQNLSKGGQNVTPNNIISIDTKVSIESGAPKRAPQGDFDFDSYLEKLHNDKRRTIQIIAFFFSEKSLRFSTLSKARVAVQRWLKSAQRLIPFTDDEIFKAADIAKAEYPRIWTLDTLLKILTR